MRVILLVVGGVGDFEVLDGQPRDIIHGDLEVHRHRPNVLPAFRGCRLAKRDLGH